MQEGNQARLEVLRGKLLAIEAANWRGCAQMNEFTLGIYHFKGTRFPASSFDFHLEDKSGKTMGMGFTELQIQVRDWGMRNRRKKKVKYLLPSDMPREKAICVSRAKFILLRLTLVDPSLSSRWTDKAIIDEIEKRD